MALEKHVDQRSLTKGETVDSIELLKWTGTLTFRDCHRIQSHRWQNWLEKGKKHWQNTVIDNLRVFCNLYTVLKLVAWCHGVGQIQHRKQVASDRFRLGFDWMDGVWVRDPLRFWLRLVWTSFWAAQVGSNLGADSRFQTSNLQKLSAVLGLACMLVE